MTIGNSGRITSRRAARAVRRRYGRLGRAVNVAAAFLFILSLAGPAGAATRLVVLGDSLVAGYGLADGDSFPAALARALAAQGRSVAVRNAGVSGETTAGLRARIGWALAEPADAAIVVTGGNDGLRALDPAQMRANLTAILDGLAARGVPVLLAGMLAPPNLGQEYGERFNAVFSELGPAKAAVFYPFFLDGVAAVPSLNQPDGIHPNTEGVQRIVERILPDVERLLTVAEGG